MKVPSFEKLGAIADSTSVNSLKGTYSDTNFSKNEGSGRRIWLLEKRRSPERRNDACIFINV